MDWDAPFTHKFLCLMKTLPAARNAVFAELVRMVYGWGLQGICNINKTQCIIEFSNGSMIRCMGLDDSNKLRSISGITGVFMEEMDMLTEHDFLQTNLRLRGNYPTYFQILGAFNPVSKFSWLYNMFFAPEPQIDNPDDLRTHFSTYKDNPFVDPSYKRSLENMEKVDQWYYKVYTLGEWGSLDNVIYTQNDWDIVPHFPPLDELDRVCFGLDFGYTHPHALVMLGFNKDGIFAKQISYKKHKTTSYIINQLNRLLDDEDIPFTTSTKLWCDAANPDKIEEIRRSGFNAKAVDKPAYSVRGGIDIVKRNKLHITEDSYDIIKEINKYKWKEGKAGEVLEEPVKIDDDAMDAIRYGAYMTLRKKKEIGVLFAAI